MDFLEIYWTDVYKTGHKPMLPTGSTLMYSNNTPRSGKYSNSPNNGEIVVFGQQMLVRKMKKDWDVNFFNRPVEDITLFGEDMTTMLGLSTPYDISHIVALHKLGYLPVRIKAMEEGSVVPYKIPSFTIVNTQPIDGTIVDWLVNYLETILSAESWQAPTSATFIRSLRKMGKEFIMKTNPEAIDFLDYQFHDFSMRGMGGKSAIVNSGLGFATGSRGSDTLPVIPAARMYYDEVEPCINSVIASEHAIMCSLTGFFMQNAKGDWDKVADFEYEMFVYLLKKFPSGILSLVMDTFDLWRAITEYCVKAKDIILARDGKLVIRPDSGDPVDILCGLDDKYEVRDGVVYTWTNDYKDLGSGNQRDTSGYNKASKNSLSEYKGVIELLWDVFGGTTSSTGYKVLDSHIGAIYGDSINYDRAKRIFERLEDKGFASTNVVLGIGSYSLQFTTRDTHGSAQKATYIEIGKTGIEIFKDPITDDGIKKSAKGLLKVYKDENNIIRLKDQCTWEEEGQGLLQVIFEDGIFYNLTTLTKIRERLNN
jgi:nicotinamide phosphoribosyltransferase